MRGILSAKGPQYYEETPSIVEKRRVPLAMMGICLIRPILWAHVGCSDGSCHQSGGRMGNKAQATL